RKYDFTCCDFQPAVIARNILLLTLLLDHHYNDSLWNLYYHVYVSFDDLQTLNDHARKLVSSATDPETWKQSSYGQKIHFCDSGTLDDVRDIWRSYAVLDISPTQRVEHSKCFKKSAFRANALRKDRMGEDSDLSMCRSADPVGSHAMEDAKNFSREYWKTGSVSSATNTNKCGNPTLASIATKNLTLHYGLSPLCGFHLASAYAPTCNGTKKALDLAKEEFRSWCSAYKHKAHNIVTRFFSGDALAFSHALQSVAGGKGATHHGLYRTRYSYKPLILDDGYASTNSAPSSFNVIDTSNVLDSVGALNLLIATEPLLRDSASSTLYTDTLVKSYGDLKLMATELLHGDLPTLSLLLGLFPLEYWTNSTSTPFVDEAARASIMNQGGQMPCRLLWKRSIRVSKIQFAADQLAELLFKTYLAIFSSEDLSTLLTVAFKADSHKVARSFFPKSHRPSFVGLIQCFQRHASSDWEKVIKMLLSKIVQDQTLSSGGHYIQELYLYLHLSGLFDADVLVNPTAHSHPMVHAKGFSRWESMPGAICVTIKVPRSDLRPLTQYLNNPTKIGTPCLIGGLESPSEPRERPWLNLFSAVSLCFGDVISSGDPASDGFDFQVAEDKEGWHGQSPLMLTFWAPSFILLQDFPKARASVRIQSTPHAVTLFFKDTNPTLTIYESNLGNTGNVFISKRPPELQDPPLICAGPNTSPPQAVIDGSRMTLSGFLDSGNSKLDCFTARLEMVEESAIALLQDKRNRVEKIQLNPLTLKLMIGAGTHAKIFQIELPLPVDNSKAKLRIARTSKYVDVVLPRAAAPFTDAFPNYLFPTLHRNTSPLVWNTTYRNLDQLSALDVNDKSKVAWLNTHMSLAWSEQERREREACMNRQASTSPRINFKESLFSILSHFIDLGGPGSAKSPGRASWFGLNCESNGGVHIIIYVSCIRLDNANHTIVMDGGVLPLAIDQVPKLQKHLAEIIDPQFSNVQVKVNEAELALWNVYLIQKASKLRSVTMISPVVARFEASVSSQREEKNAEDREKKERQGEDVKNTCSNALGGDNDNKDNYSNNNNDSGDSQGRYYGLDERQQQQHVRTTRPTQLDIALMTPPDSAPQSSRDDSFPSTSNGRHDSGENIRFPSEGEASTIIKGLEESLATKEQEVQELEAEVATQRAEIEELRGERRAENKRMIKALKNNDSRAAHELKRRCDELFDVIESQESYTQRLEEQLQEQRKQKLAANQELREVKTEYQEYVQREGHTSGNAGSTGGEGEVRTKRGGKARAPTSKTMDVAMWNELKRRYPKLWFCACARPGY
ncbi:MAG: hypothetical protein M1831_006831, partial [Alyxoria varia]